MVLPSESSFALACDQISTLIGAIVLQHDDAVPYTRITHGESADQGPSGYRNFWFSDPLEIGQPSTRGRALWTVRIELEIRIRIHLGGKTLRERPNVLWHEGKEIMIAIDSNDHWTDGTETVSTRGMRFESVGSDDVILAVRVAIWIQERRP